METFFAVDWSSYSDRAIVTFVAKNPSPDSKVRLCMIVNTFVPPPVTSLVDGLGYYRSSMQYHAYDRLEQLAGVLRSRNITVEVDLFETRIPESSAIIIRALQADADRLVVGIHSLLGIKRLVIQRVFGWLNSPTVNEVLQSQNG